MAVLLFFDDKHEYEADGEQLPSVSEILRFMSREIYTSVSQYRLDNAADRGKRVHKACELLDKYGEAEIEKDIAPYVNAYVNFRKEYSPDWDKVEYACYEPDMEFAGTLDRYGTVRGRRVIVDLKTVSAVNKPYVTAQLNGYAVLARANGLAVEALYCLHLRKDGTYRFTEMPLDDPAAPLSGSAFMPCYILHKIFQKKGRKKWKN